MTSKSFSITFAAIETGMIFAYVPSVSKARSAASDALKLFDAQPDIDAQDPSGIKLDNCTGRINFRNVHFRYPTRPHVPVLRGLDLDIEPGQFVAIVVS